MTHPDSEQAPSQTPATIDPPQDSAVAAPIGPAFAHASEAEMGRILDFYAVRWEYEPHRFPILWNLDGAVVESFSPDFYLPDLDLYLEMTTLRQRLVRKKNRKLRRLRELYPDLRIKLFYARDFRALMLKYGKLALINALSGTSGQVGPVRDASLIIVDALPEPVPVPDVPLQLEPVDAAPVPATPPAAAAPARPGRRGRDDGARRLARRPARPDRTGSGR